MSTINQRAMILGAVIGGILVVPACSGSAVYGGGSPNVPTATTSSQFASAYAHAVCDNLAPCCSKNSLAFNGANCFSAVDGIIQGLVVNQATAMGATYNPSTASACLSQLVRTVTQCSDSGSIEPDACRGVFTGTSQPGQPCMSPMNCVPAPAGSYMDCIVGAGINVGMFSACQVVTPATAGATCGSFAVPPPSMVSDCDFDRSPVLMCDPHSQTCTARTPIGGNCFNNGNCVVDAACTNSVCTARVPVGSPCTEINDPCERTAYCASGTCAPLKSAGQPCMIPTECAGTCTDGACRTSAFASASFCGG